VIGRQPRSPGFLFWGGATAAGASGCVRPASHPPVDPKQRYDYDRANQAHRTSVSDRILPRDRARMHNIRHAGRWIHRTRCDVTSREELRAALELPLKEEAEPRSLARLGLQPLFDLLASSISVLGAVAEATEPPWCVDLGRAGPRLYQRVRACRWGSSSRPLGRDAVAALDLQVALGPARAGPPRIRLRRRIRCCRNCAGDACLGPPHYGGREARTSLTPQSLRSVSVGA